MADDEQEHMESQSLGFTRDYWCKPEVAAEIRSLRDVPDEQLVEVDTQSRELETLVRAIRRLIRAGREAEATVLEDILLRRAERVIARVARNQFADSPSDREDAIQEVTLRLWQKVGDCSPKEEFWEANFYGAVAHVCSNVADSIRRVRGRERQFDRGENEEGIPRDEEAEVADPDEMDTALYAPEALALLDGDRRRAIQLDMLGFKQKSNNPQEPTISSLLGVSDRTVREWLREAKATLREYHARIALEDERGSA